MKNLIAPCLAISAATAIAFAGPAEDAAAAAKKLTAAPNYSFTRTTEIANSQFPAMPVEGQTEKGGVTVTTASFNGNTFQTVRKGEQVAMQNREGQWMSMEEIHQQFAGGGNAGGGGGRGRGGFGFGMFGGGQVNPAEDAAMLATKIKEAKVQDGAIVGTLSAEDVAPLLSFGGRGGRGGQGGGQTPPAPKNASGTAKFWVKDGALTKYAVTVKGTVTIPGGEERDVERTTTTEFKNVGTTKVTVPEEAKKKLGM